MTMINFVDSYQMMDMCTVVTVDAAEMGVQGNVRMSNRDHPRLISQVHM
jgi:hypothetical protein